MKSPVDMLLPRLLWVVNKLKIRAIVVSVIFCAVESYPVSLASSAGLPKKNCVKGRR